MLNQSAAHGTRKPGQESGQVLPFRRPGQPPVKSLAIVDAPEPRPRTADEGLARYDEERDEPVDERQRMLTNLVAVAVVFFLISLGVWIADAIQISSQNEDCALQGRTNCAPIEMQARR